MHTLDLTLPTSQENLACDEALLDLCEDGFGHETLRFWEPQKHFAVLGYSNKIRREINEVSCRRLKIPVLRRASGGGTVLQGPGCLNFTLILKVERHAALKSITRTNVFIMKRHQEALEPLVGRPVAVQGHTDLTVDNLKFSGNAQRRKRKCVLFHGTFLLNFDIALIEEILLHPPKEPDYRKNRPHAKFLTNVDLSPETVKEALKKIWGTDGTLKQIPAEKIEKLVSEKYSKDEWNLKF
ncbi:MAG: lipoate--protein ligase family protein [Candidatus Omnitrophota bacterium]